MHAQVTLSWAVHGEYLVKYIFWY